MPDVRCRGCDTAGRCAPPSGASAADCCAPGWHPMLTAEGRAYYFCPDCSAKLHKLAEGIMAIVGDDFLYFPSLLRMKPNG